MTKFRAGLVADALSMGQIQREAMVFAIPTWPLLHTVEEDLTYFSKVVAERKVWIAEIEGEMVGYCAGHAGWLNQLYVLPNFHGRGIGSKFLNLAKEMSPSEIQLWTFQANGIARDFYRKRGFLEVEFTDGVGNEEKLPDIRLIWRGIALE